MAHRHPSRSRQGAQAGLSALYGKAARRARVLISPGSVPRRWMYHAWAPGRLRAVHSVLRRLAWSPGGRKERDVGGHARVQGVRCPENRHDRSEELLQALAVPVPAARAWAEAHPQDRTRLLAAGHRGAVSRGFRAEGCFIRTATEASTECAGIGAAASTGTSTRAICSSTTPRTFSGSAAQTLDQLGRRMAVLQAEHHLCGAQGGRGAAGRVRRAEVLKIVRDYAPESGADPARSSGLVPGRRL